MWFSISEHLRVTFYSLIMGFFLGVLYDLVKLTRIFFGIGSYSRVTEVLCAKELPFIGALTVTKRDKTSDSIPVCALYFLGDIIYALISAAFYSLFLFHAIRGQVRWYFIAASAAGFFLYYFSVSRIVRSIFEVILFIVRVFFAYLTRILFAPLRLLFSSLLKLFKKVYAAVVIRIWESLKYTLAKKRTEKVMAKIKDNISFNF